MALVAMIAWLFISLKIAGPKFFVWEALWQQGG